MFPKGKERVMFKCEKNEWKLQDENWTTLPACQRKNLFNAAFAKI